MKQLISLLVILLVTSVSIACAQNKIEEKEGYQSYPSVVEGLRQFPLGGKVQDEKVMATVVDSEGLIFLGDETASIKLTLVTIEGDLIDIIIKGERVNTELWMHEVYPFFGKYVYWNSVLILPRKQNGSAYWYFEIAMEGRFCIVRADENNPNKVTRYENDVFRILK